MSYSDRVQEELANAQETSIANKIIDMMQHLNLSNDETNSCRWIWELIQNAKDVVNSSGCINIKINLCEEKNILTFEHNGKIFTTKNMVFLISQVSSKDREEAEEDKTTGKFGTGFLTTHLLSEEVLVEGLLQDPGDKIKRIKVRLDRSRETKDGIIKSIKESFEQLKDSEEIQANEGIDENLYNTKFTYILDQKGIEVAKKGIESLQIAAPYIFSFLSVINSISINGMISYYREWTKGVAESQMIISLIRVEKKEEAKNIIILKNTNLDVDIAVPVRVENENITIEAFEKETPKLFCDFPLVGTEAFCFPVIINSSTFNPTEPRDGIFLTDKDHKFVLENKRIILKALEAYKEMLEYAVYKKWRQMYNAVNFLPQPEKIWLYKPWLIENIVDPCKDFIKKTEIVDTEVGERVALYDWMELPSVYLIGDSEKNIREEVWKLTRFIWPDMLMRFSEMHKWYGSLWRECRNFDITELIKKVESCEQLKSLSELLDNRIFVIDWLNRLYKTVLTLSDKSIYYSAKIFPNQLGVFCTIGELLIDDGIEDIYKDILCLLNNECREQLLDGRVELQNDTTLSKYTYNDLFEEIEKAIAIYDEEVEVYKQIIILYDDENINGTDVLSLIKMIGYMFPGALEGRKKVQEVSESIMKKAKKYWCTELANEVSNCESLDNLNKILSLPHDYTVNMWMADYIDYIVKYKHENLLDKKTKPIVPNQNGIFFSLESIFLDSGEIDEIFKDILRDDNNDIREKLLLKDIFLNLPNNRTLYMKDISHKIVDYVKDNQGKNKSYDLNLISNLKNLYLWIDDNQEKAKQYFPEIIENKHWLYNDHEIAENMRKAESYDELMERYNVQDVKELEDILKQVNKENAIDCPEDEEITEEILIQSGISSEEEFARAVDMHIFKNNFIHVSESGSGRFDYVKVIIKRSCDKIISYLKQQPEYDLNEMIPLSNTIYIIKKYGKEMYLIIRPSDCKKVIIFHDLEKDVLDYEKEWELWVEDGKTRPERITFGKMLKLTGINVIPLIRIK